MPYKFTDDKLAVTIDRICKQTYDFAYGVYFNWKYRRIAKKEAKLQSRNSFYRKKKTERIATPVLGRYYDISCMPDRVFAEKILGDGVAIELYDHSVVSPVEGTIVTIAKTKHAYCIRDVNGAEILIHIGINTVNLKGRGFTCYVRAGQKVKKGTLLCRVDLKYIKSSGYISDAAMIVTNMKNMKFFKVYHDKRRPAIEYEVISYKYGEPESNICPLK